MGGGNYAKYFGVESSMFIRVLGIYGMRGGLTRDFWGVFEGIIFWVGLNGKGGMGGSGRATRAMPTHDMKPS